MIRPELQALRGRGGSRRSAPPGWAALGFLLLVAVAATGAPRDAMAQSVRGTLVEEGSGSPIPAAFVVLQDTAGQALSSTLTSVRGTWLLRAPAPGTHILHEAQDILSPLPAARNRNTAFGQDAGKCSRIIRDWAGAFFHYHSRAAIAFAYRSLRIG